MYEIDLTNNQLQQKIEENISVFCSKGIWTLQEDNVFGWLSNFYDNKQFLHFAYLLLDKVIFRNKEMLLSAYRNFFSTAMQSDYLIDLNESYTVPNFINSLLFSDRKLIESIRVMPLVDKNSSHTESGPQILRYLQANLINPRFSLNYEGTDILNLSENCTVFLVDDFIGSGDQCIEFFKRTKIHEKIKNLVYVPAMALASGLKKVNKNYPNLRISPLEIIDDDVGVFCGNNDDKFNKNDTMTKEEARNIYLKIKESNNIPLPNWLGRNDSSLPLIFEWGVPNQSLGIFFHQSEGNWRKLHYRRGV